MIYGNFTLHTSAEYYSIKAHISLVGLGVIFCSTLHALPVNFVTTGGSPTAGTLQITQSTAFNLDFLNMNNEGYDLNVTYTGTGATTSGFAFKANGTTTITSGVVLTNALKMAAGTYTFTFSQPVLGLAFRFDDMDNGESISNFTAFNNVTSAFEPTSSHITVDAGQSITLTPSGNASTISSAKTPTNNTSSGRGATVDLSATEITTVQFTVNPLSAEQIYITGGLGNLFLAPVTPVPFEPSPILGFATLGGLLAVRIRRNQKQAAA